jgi:hypothetical protein
MAHIVHDEIMQASCTHAFLASVVNWLGQTSLTSWRSGR